MPRNQPTTFVILVSILAILAGCSSSERIYDLSGAVTYQDKPVPAGHIRIEPDTSAGNSGPSGFAKIKDGRYDTRVLDGRGTIGGPHLVFILGLDGVPRGELLNGLPVFPDYSTTVDLPKKSGTYDFAVPKK
jgi:hypothetical protein